MIIRVFRYDGETHLIYEGTNFKKAKQKAFKPLEQIGYTEKDYDKPIINRLSELHCRTITYRPIKDFNKPFEYYHTRIDFVIYFKDKLEKRDRGFITDINDPLTNKLKAINKNKRRIKK